VRSLCASASPPSPEFTLSLYIDSSQQGRGDQFCLLTLSHPAFSATGGTSALRDVYTQKADDAASTVDELFDTEDSSVALDKAQLVEAFEGIGLPSTDGQIEGLITRLEASGDGQHQRTEYADLLREAWGGAPAQHHPKRACHEVHAWHMG
jgi:hypothetical protein